MAKFCSNCGASLADDATFCSACGQAQGQAQPQYQQPQYQQPGVPMAKPANGLAIAALVCGIVSFFLFPIVFGVLGIAFGGVAKSKGNRSGMATAGIVCGIIGVVSWIILMIAFQNAVGWMF